MAPTFDDEDLSMSLANTNSRRGQNTTPSMPAQSSSQGMGKEASGSRPPQTRSSQRLGQSSQRLGQYDVKRTLGEGSFGKVKLAVHRVSGQEVALKIISRRKLISRDMAGRVEREIQYLQLLRHPHIIKLYTVITTPSEIIMVLEYAGNELFDYIVKLGRMNEERARRFFQQIICAVEYCHRHKIVHRDLKPENLLLDKDLNVKIADFGLSNIMTDGNFLKTSCGSPNYAAPEVISGKLYAGPEVDVWSCGVILYVLLVGRLPFDDEYIPSLFKKIASGNYHTPSYLSSGAVRIIKRMLVVNPVQRITVQEIRQDSWFNIGLADYLQPPVEEFIDTGVDPNKAIDPRKLAPGKPVALQEQLHDSVVGKLGKTMGYAKGDVQDALQKDEPSAIKDAYLIVRENQIIGTNTQTTHNEDMQSFLAQAPPPPAMGTNMSTQIPTETYESVQLKEFDLASTSTEATHDVSGAQSGLAPNASTVEAEEKPYVSQISILPSSMPYWHDQYMEKLKADELNAPYEADPEPDYATSFAQLSTADTTDEQSSEEQAATARHLKPNSRSTTHLHNITAAQAKNPEALTPVPPKKPRPTKWQFGIRSRNSPLEAMSCIYRALLKQGAEWECPPEEPTRVRNPPVGPEGVPVRIVGAEHSSHALSGNSGSHSSDEGEDRMNRKQDDGNQSASPDGGSLHHENSLDRDDDDPSIIPPNYIPADPWCIKVRWRKDGMYPPGTVHAPSTRGSKVDLPASSDDQARPRSSTISSLSSAAGSATSVAGSSATSNRAVTSDSVYIYMDVQLYQLEHDFYLVDFKCAGYEALISTVAGELVGSGFRVFDKNVTSPFPFLDAASKLIVQLAEAD